MPHINFTCCVNVAIVVLISLHQREIPVHVVVRQECIPPHRPGLGTASAGRSWKIHPYLQTEQLCPFLPSQAIDSGNEYRNGIRRGDARGNLLIRFCNYKFYLGDSDASNNYITLYNFVNCAAYHNTNEAKKRNAQTRVHLPSLWSALLQRWVRSWEPLSSRLSRICSFDKGLMEPALCWRCVQRRY